MSLDCKFPNHLACVGQTSRITATYWDCKNWMPELYYQRCHLVFIVDSGQDEEIFDLVTRVHARWIWALWYKNVAVLDCKNVFLYIKWFLRIIDILPWVNVNYQQFDYLSLLSVTNQNHYLLASICVFIIASNERYKLMFVQVDWSLRHVMRQMYEYNLSVVWSYWLIS